MAQILFPPAAAPVALGIVAGAIGCPLPAAADPARLLAGLADLNWAGPDELTYVDGGAAVADLAATCAAACLVTADRARDLPPATIALVTEDLASALRRVALLFHPSGFAPEPVFPGEPSTMKALVHPDARLEANVRLDAGVVVGPRAQIGTGTSIGAHTIVGADVAIGRGCRIDAHVSLRHALVGDRVVIHAGAQIGLGSRDAGKYGPPEVRAGRVIVQDDVTIGANAVLERGILADTTIGEAADVDMLARVRAGTSVPRASKWPAAEPRRTPLIHRVPRPR